MQTERALLVEKLVYSNDQGENLHLRGQITVYDQWLRASDGIRGKSIIEQHYNQILNPQPPPGLESLGTTCEEDSGQNY